MQSYRAENKSRPVPGLADGDFKNAILAVSRNEGYDPKNIFDDRRFIPGRDPVDKLFITLDSSWRDERKLPANAVSFSGLKTAQRNLSVSAAFFPVPANDDRSDCEEKGCPVFAEIIRSTQVMFLYVEGNLVDTFLVSTGMSGYETPDFSLHPSGPLYKRYTSRKFPGGNYRGLGNMPYAVFVKGGYAIHGTTKGNFKKLGSPASHGCIRLHPDNAKIFYELVKQVGLEQTWVTVKEE